MRTARDGTLTRRMSNASATARKETGRDASKERLHMLHCNCNKRRCPSRLSYFKTHSFFLSAIAKYTFSKPKKEKCSSGNRKVEPKRRQNSFRYVNKLAYNIKLSALVDFKNGKVLIFNRQYYSQFSEVQIKGFDTTPPK